MPTDVSRVLEAKKLSVLNPIKQTAKEKETHVTNYEFNNEQIKHCDRGIQMPLLAEDNLPADNIQTVSPACVQSDATTTTGKLLKTLIHFLAE